MERLPCLTHDPEIWFPVGSGPAFIHDSELAKAWCRLCPIVAACLQRALDSGESGIWGATDENERRVMISTRERSMDSEEARRIVHRALAST